MIEIVTFASDGTFITPIDYLCHEGLVVPLPREATGETGARGLTDMSSIGRGSLEAAVGR
jgi:hypothetical protein